MRDLLEALPGALMPDPRHESDDPGVPLRPLSSSPLVAPLQDDHGPRNAAEGSPLLQHLRLHIAPFDVRVGAALGLRLELAGANIMTARVEVGFLARGIANRSQGLSAPDAAALWLQASPFGGLAATIAMVRAAERILGVGIETDRLRQAREASLSFAAMGHDLDVLSSSAFAWSSSDERSLRRLRDDVARELAGLTLGTPLAQPYALSRPLDGELQAMARLADDAARILNAPRRSVPDAVRAWSGIGVVSQPSRGLLRIAPRLGPVGASLLADDNAPSSRCTMARLWHRWRATVDHAVDVRRWLTGPPEPSLPRQHHRHRLSCGTAAAANGPVTAVLALDGVGLVLGSSVHGADAGLLPVLESALSHTNLEDAVAVVHSFGLDIGLIDG
jgi:hypothetical protein